MDLISRWDPERIIDNPDEFRALRAAGLEAAARDRAGAASADPGPIELDMYARVLHRRWGGPWDWDLTLKPVYPRLTLAPTLTLSSTPTPTPPAPTPA